MNGSHSRVAIVTGAGRGIGAVAARKLADDGLAVDLLDLDDAAVEQGAETIIAAGGKAIGIGLDVSNTE